MARPEARTVSRTNMFVAGTLCWADQRSPVRIRNMSPSGALLESPTIPTVGTAVRLLRGSYCVEGRIAWVARGRCGITLASSVTVRDWMAPPGNEQQRVDQVVALVKAGTLPLPTGPLTGRGGRPELAQALTGEQLTADLNLVARLLEGLGDDLASDPATLARHATKLQNLDIAMQMIAAICGELSAGDGGDGTQMARLEDLRTSCGEALPVYS